MSTLSRPVLHASATQRILNADQLLRRDDRPARRAMVEILEAGLQATDPYHNMLKLVTLHGEELHVDNSLFEPEGDPRSGPQIFDLRRYKNIYVLGAGKGSQRMAKALEEVLADRITGGHVVDKRGHPVELRRIEVSLGGHPVPDENCVEGSRRIRGLADACTAGDLVFTCISNGVSSALTLPPPGVSLDAVRELTVKLQIEYGMPTVELNGVRNHVDMLKGGRLSRYIQPATAIHIFAHSPSRYEDLLLRNNWLHTLPDYTTFELAERTLHRWNLWWEIPSAVRDFIGKADPAFESVKSAEFQQWPTRIFGIMPGFKATAKLAPAMEKARNLGFAPILLTDELYGIEAMQGGKFLGAVCKTIERTGTPFRPPCALFSSGELVVSVGREDGVGGRNQEFVLAAAQTIEGCSKITIGSVDTDGTDGPGFSPMEAATERPICLAGGIVDGTTAQEAAALGIDIEGELRRHNTSPALLALDSGVVAAPNISLVDLTVALIEA